MEDEEIQLAEASKMEYSAASSDTSGGEEKEAKDLTRPWIKGIFLSKQEELTGVFIK